jgi:hypothetical protein
MKALAFLSVLGMAGSVALWVRSHHFADWIELYQWNLTTITAHGNIFILGHQGRLAVPADAPFFMYSRRRMLIRYAEPPRGSVAKIDLLGLKYYEFPPPLAVSWMLVVPLWLPMALCSLGAAYGSWCWRQCRGRRTEQYLCARCAYDLRAHKPGDKCPECGSTVPRRPVPITTPSIGKPTTDPPNDIIPPSK